ncbi:MAG: phosphatase PAP2 family protein [Novosphingobium sp.]|nr:phosphatase PAP2 family protein [Novosphingobium sp.]
MQSAYRIRALLRRHHVDSFILVLFLAGAAGLLAFLMVASEVREGETLAFDRWLLLALRDPAHPAVPVGPAWVRQMLTDFTSLGGTPVLTLITVASAGYLLVARRVETALFLVVAIAGGALASTSLKLLFSRARPELVQHLVEVTNASFPSGHAMNSAVTYLTLGALLARTEKSTAIRIYLIALAILLTLTIGFSRVYLGVHWPSDVIAGWCLGGAWAVLCSLAARTLQRRRMLEPES